MQTPDEMPTNPSAASPSPLQRAAGRAVQPLPIDELLPAVHEALRVHTGLVVAAPPGTGKTTRVAPAIAELDAIAGRVVLLEPRRLAAIAAARRIAEERGVALGREVGHQVRFDRRWGSATRLVVATEGILVQWLLEDPVLEGVGCIVFDEVHERNVATDLALAMALRVRQVREELRLVAMSATLDAGRFADLLGDPLGDRQACGRGPVVRTAAPVVRCATWSHPVDVRYAPRPDDRPLERRVVAAVRSAWRELDAGSRANPALAGPVPDWLEAGRGPVLGPVLGPGLGPGLGSVLAFLPGVGEIERCRELLEGEPAAGAGPAVPVLPLHGSLPLEQQEAALRGGRRVVLATNVAESSVTVEGVGAVVDSGLERIQRFDPASGLDRLELTTVSRASADQRAGRAGRTGPGRCLRLWTESEQGARVAQRQPEIQRVDLAAVVLTVRVWGEDPATLRWPDAPTAAQLERAETLLRELGALREDGSATERGLRMARLPLHPRLASLVLFTAERARAAEGALLAALIAERDPFRRAPAGEAEALSDLRSDVLERWLALADAQRGRHDPRLHRGAAQRVLRAAEQIGAQTPIAGRAAEGGDRRGRAGRVAALRSDPETQEILLRAILAAYPDRVARRREPRSPRAVLAGGHGVRLSPSSRVRSAPLFVCLSIGTAGGGASAAGRETAVHSASAVEEAWLDTRTEEAATLDEASGRVTLRRRRLYRDLVLDEVELGPAPAERAAPLLARWALRDPRRGLGLDRDEIASFLARLGCLREWRPDLALPDLGLPDLGYRDLVPAAAERAAPAPTLPAALDALAPAWSGVLEAAVAGARSTADVARAPVLDLLRGSISWELLQKLDELAPERIALPNGRTAAIRYELGSSPVLAARIQDLFGWRETPRIAGGRVPLLLHLLAPNFRPQQVTDDLAGFWQRTYPMVRKELAGRYPKHAWPADGAAAEPVKGPGRRSRG